jgi:hypothetical protein
MIRHTKRVLKITGGFLLLIAGALMLVLPGPGIVAIGLGLALLAGEFTWARDLLHKMKERATELKDRVIK